MPQTITVATTPAQLEAVATYWDELPVSTPHASRGLSTLVQQASPYSAQPYVIRIERDDESPIFVVARIERRPVRIKAGYRTLMSIRARWLVVVAGGVVGATTDADYELVMRTLSAALRRGTADLLELSKVELGGPLHGAANRHVGWYRRGHGGAVYKWHRSDLSRGFDGFLAARSKNTRWRLKRRLKALGEGTSAGQKMTTHRIGPGDDIDSTVRALDAIASSSYQRGIGVGFVDDDLHRGLLSWAIADGPYRIWTLSIDDRPVAYVSGMLHARTFYLFETAFDQSLAEDEPGAILLARVLEELANDPGVDGFDYGYGDAQYKQSLSDACDEVLDVVAFAGRPRPLLLNALDSGMAYAVSTAKRLLGPERVARMKRGRRHQAAGSGD
jgi:hypothetical protein